MARGVVGGAGGHRVDGDRRLLALELVDRADARAVGQVLLQLRDLRVVGRDDEDVVERRACASCPSLSVHVLTDEVVDELADALRFFG